MKEVPNHGAIILVTDGPEGIRDDIALWAAFAARWHDITIYLAIRQKLAFQLNIETTRSILGTHP